tara:strand:- start:272 stop:460 length:189 start_codon:yes stop_codon:yes gene_type:complete
MDDEYTAGLIRESWEELIHLGVTVALALDSTDLAPDFIKQYREAVLAAVRCKLNAEADAAAK